MEKTKQKASRAVALLVILAMALALIPTMSLPTSGSTPSAMIDETVSLDMEDKVSFVITVTNETLDGTWLLNNWMNHPATNWFTGSNGNMPAGLTAEIISYSVENGTIEIRIRGEATEASSAPIKFTVPAVALIGTNPITSTDNPNAKWAITVSGPTPSARIDDVTISGTINSLLTPQTMTIKLTNDTFKVAVNTGCANYFSNKPGTIEAKVTAVGATSVTIEISGTPTQINTSFIGFDIPTAWLTNSTSMLSTTRNDNAKWAVTDGTTPDPAANYTLFFKDGGSGYNLFMGDTTNVYTGNGGNGGGKWEVIGDTLTLSDFEFETSANVAMTATDGAVINLAPGSVNKVKTTSHVNSSVGLRVYYNVEIKGTGELEIIGGTSTTIPGTGLNSRGIDVISSETSGINKSVLTISGGKITATSPSMNKSWGVYSNNSAQGGHVKMTGGTLIASGSELAIYTLDGDRFDLSELTSYKWRTSDTGEYTQSSSTPFTNAGDPTYVEIVTLSGGGQQGSTEPTTQAPTTGGGSTPEPTPEPTTPAPTQGNQGGGYQPPPTQQQPQQQQPQAPATIPGFGDDKNTINVPITVGSGANAGNVTVSMNVSAQDKLVTDALAKAEQAKEASPETADDIKPTVTLDLTGVAAAKSAVFNVSAADKFSTSEVAVALKLPAAEIVLSPIALGNIAAVTDKGATPVKVEASVVNMKGLQGMQAAQVKGYETVVNIDIFVGGTKVDVPVTVSLPYKLKQGEKAKGVRAWHMSDKGNLTCMKGVYNQGTGRITFTVSHQSYFVVGYDEFMTWENIYKDIDADAWYYDAVAFASYIGVMQGYGGDIFAPDDKMTRAMFVTILWNLDGKPEANGTAKFSDVDAGVYYDAIMWAVENKIAEATGAGLFSPDRAITRQDMAAILYAYAKYKGYEITANRDMPEYTDFEDVAWWAETAVKKLSEAGVFNGMSEDEPIFAPKATATRAQVSQTFRNFMKFVVGD